MLKGYEDGMTKGGEGLHARSDFVLNNKISAEAMSGGTAMGKFVDVSLGDVCPINETYMNKGEGDPE